MRMMGNRRVGRGRLLSALVTAGVVAAFVPSAASAESYVAMGDSYTVTGSETTLYKAETSCPQSADSYPYRVAEALHLSLTDVACGGADTEDFTKAQYEDQPPQFDALNASTEVVSLGMGGNDHNLFATLIQGCTEAGFLHTNENAPCKAELKEFVEKTLAEDKGPAETALKEIHTLSPHAKVFVVGYPDIMPKDGICGEGFRFWRPGDIKWFRSIETHGDAEIKSEARANGAIYVETFKQSVGHDACQELGTRWIEPLFNPANGVAVHPNGLGAENDAFDLELAMLKAGVR